MIMMMMMTIIGFFISEEPTRSSCLETIRLVVLSINATGAPGRGCQYFNEHS